MASINKVILIGNLGTDPKLRQTQGGPVCSLFVITNESWVDGSGQRQERSEGHSVTVWGKQAENCARYLAKGRQVYIEGSIHSRTYSDKDGVERKAWDVKARTVQFLSGGDGQRQGGQQSGGGGGSQQSGGGGGWGKRPRGQQGQSGGWGGNGGSQTAPVVSKDADDPIPF